MDRSFRFHDPMVLPAGSRLAIPALAIQTDPDNFDNPLTFNAFRFARQDKSAQEDAEDERNCSVTAVSPTNLVYAKKSRCYKDAIVLLTGLIVLGTGNTHVLVDSTP